MQLTPRARDVLANLARVRELLATSREADLLVLSELFLSGYELTGLEPRAAERIGEGVANSAVCIDRSGELAGVYRKAHLFGAERDAYVPGDELTTVELSGRNVGPMICFDMEFPEVARTLALRGADLLVTISANPFPFEVDHDLFARTRALENGLSHVYVNRVGEEAGLRFAGGSLALDPDARVLAEAGREVERVLEADIGVPKRRDPRTRYSEFLRGALYAEPRAATAGHAEES